MKKLIFIPSNEEKQQMIECSNEVISTINECCKDNLGMKVFIMNSLIAGFKDAYNVDLKNDSTLRTFEEE